jgi:5-formyltetrahydrofolate cyclo-ligase
MSFKDTIRQRIRARRRRLAPAFIRTASARIQRAVLGLPEWQASRSVCLYLALPGEVQTGQLLRACWKSGKRVLVPALRPACRRYALAQLRPDEPLRAGRWNVPEPARPRWMPSGKADCVVVPGLAFDRRGGRLGHGGGHYDRLLVGAALRRAFKAGLALECQVTARVPMQKRDIRMDAVVTEKAIYRRKRKL